MKFSKLINSFLSPLGVVIVRRSTLARISESLTTTSKNEVYPALESLLNIRFASVDSKIETLRIQILRQEIAAKWDVIDYIEQKNSNHSAFEECPLCEYKASIDEFLIFESQCIFGGGYLKRFQCPACDVVFGAKKMLALNDAQLTQDYESHYQVFNEGDSTEQEIRAFHLLNPSKNGVYLNYGAGGWSKSVQILRNQGWNVFAFEPHSSAVSSSDFLINNKLDLLDIQFDGIFSNNVLEHFRFPVDEFLFMKKILKDGGKMAHATPCFEYLYEYTRFHLFFYLGRSRFLLAEKAGLIMTDLIIDDEFMCALYEVKKS